MPEAIKTALRAWSCIHVRRISQRLQEKRGIRVSQLMHDDVSSHTVFSLPDNLIIRRSLANCRDWCIYVSH